MKVTNLKSKGSKIFDKYDFCSDIIRLASNLVHANTKAQDFLVKNEFLCFFLLHTNRDKYNLYGKEVTVVFVRYMTE